MIDFHCHLDLYSNPHQVARECISRDLYVLSVTTTPSAWNGTVALAGEASRIRTALGLHPQIAHERKAELPLFEQLLGGTRYVGEIGLDGTPAFRAHWRDQLDVLTAILRASSAAGGRILSVHSRQAATAVLDSLAKTEGAGTPVLHWFSGTQRELARAVGMGCWFSVGPAMIASEKGRALAARMPRDRVLPESDGPFAHVSGRAAVPWDVEVVISGFAKLWSEPVTAVRGQLGANLKALVGRSSA